MRFSVLYRIQPQVNIVTSNDEESSKEFDRIETLEELADALSLLGNETRLRVIGALKKKKMFIQEIAQELNLSYPLLHLHLKNLEKNGVVKSEYSVGEDKSTRYVKRYFELVDFKFEITPELVERLATQYEAKQNE
ncbi:MAG: ArsR family transcriptional regulator [Candidatus Lokiarchaeota archaeon]|nr:ArsR family transcriptional regulator [Candidatus Lokiarchaeota archaeon]